MVYLTPEEQNDVASMLVGYANTFELVYAGNEVHPYRHPEIINPKGDNIRVYTMRGLEILKLAKKIRENVDAPTWAGDLPGLNQR